MSLGGHGTKWHRKIAENFTRLSRVHKRYRRQTRQTDGRAMTFSERERESTFANNRTYFSSVLSQFTSLTDRRTDRQTEFSSLDRVCIPCSAVKLTKCSWKFPGIPGGFDCICMQYRIRATVQVASCNADAVKSVRKLKFKFLVWLLYLLTRTRAYYIFLDGKKSESK